MKIIKGLWVLSAVALFSSVTFGSVSVPVALAPQQAVMDTVVHVLDGTGGGDLRLRLPISTAHAAPRKAAAAPAHEAGTVDEAETARLAQYVALHRSQILGR